MIESGRNVFARKELFWSAWMMICFACHGEPDVLCDGERVVWPTSQLFAEDDVSPEDGFQADLRLETSFDEGTDISISVEVSDEDPVELETSKVRGDGSVEFTALTVPVGSVRFRLRASTECGLLNSSRQIYVWDERGLPECSLSVDNEEIEVGQSIRVLGPNADADLGSPGFQATIRMATGRSDTLLRLFLVDSEGQEPPQSYEVAVDDQGNAEQETTLAPTTWRMRTACQWETLDLVQTSPTLSYRVSLD